MRKNIINIGDSFSRWMVIGFETNKRWYALCRCVCGTIREVKKADLNNKSSKSCGCIAKDINRERMYKHGRAYRNPTYNAWVNMKRRCLYKKHPQYRLYGGRGITVCEEWRNDFVQFLDDMGDRPSGKTLERVDNDSGYSKKNCRWAAHKENCQNTRKSKIWHVKNFKFNGLSDAGYFFRKAPRTIKGWCDGYTVNGKSYPPRNDCWSELKYNI